MLVRFWKKMETVSLPKYSLKMDLLRIMLACPAEALAKEDVILAKSTSAVITRIKILRSEPI